MAQLFVCRERDETPRWREAFPELRRVDPSQVRGLTAQGNSIWVMSNLEGWHELVKSLSGRDVILNVLSYAPTSQEALHALDAGARGYAHALSSPQVLHQVELVTKHQGIWVPPDLMARVVGGTFRALGGDKQLDKRTLSVLTEREREVALAVALGQTNKEVARHLDITERTVKAHLGSVFNKLGVRDRLQLILRLSPQKAAGLFLLSEDK